VPHPYGFQGAVFDFISVTAFYSLTSTFYIPSSLSPFPSIP
jgi:hypothetical protein